MNLNWESQSLRHAYLKYNYRKKYASQHVRQSTAFHLSVACIVDVCNNCKELKEPDDNCMKQSLSVLEPGTNVCKRFFSFVGFVLHQLK